MYCGNCGKKIEDGVAFCPECGRPTSTNNLPQKSQGRKFPKPIIVGAVIVIVALVVVFSFLSGDKAPSEEQIRISSNNLVNGGLIASDGKWLFYNGEEGLVKERLEDGEKQTIISDEIYGDHFLYWGNNLYYFSFSDYYKLTGNASEGESLGFSIFTDKCLQFDGKNYFATGMGTYDTGGIYSVKSNNIEKSELIADIHPTQILSNGEYLFVISGYGSINDKPNENYGTWRMDKDGKNQIQLLDYCPSYMVFSEDKIYYTDEDRILCSMDFDGKNEESYDGVYVGSGLNVADSYIFYVDRESSNIFRMNIDGSDKMRLNTNDSDGINIAGNWLIYEDRDDDYALTKMSFDGNVVQTLQ